MLPASRSLAALALLLWSLPALSEDAVRFAEVHFRILTSGERQLPMEVGAFHASLPLGTPGRLQREVTIQNATRATSKKVLINLSLTPLETEDGALHCMALSDALPEGGDPVSRSKDMVFSHPGEQLMELFADPATGTHLILAVGAERSEEERSADVPRWPRLRFTVKVERWDGAERTLLDRLQLVSEDGLPVYHRYDRRIPYWVEVGDEAKGQDYLSDLPILDTKDGKAVIRGDQGFSILLPKAEKKDAPSKKPEKGSEQDILAPSKPPEPKRQLTWVEERMELSITPLEMVGGAVSFKVSVSGDILDSDRGEATPLPRREETKTARPAEPAPVYLTREEGAGPRGYVLWVVPDW